VEERKRKEQKTLEKERKKWKGGKGWERRWESKVKEELKLTKALFSPFFSLAILSSLLD